jgi:nucleoside-diphosphate-sugar epimerase
MDVRNNGYGRVIPNFINGILENNHIDIFGDGNQVRSFIWIEDMVEALGLLVQAPDLPLVLNIGNQESISINKLSVLMFEVFGKSTKIRFSKKDTDDPEWRKPNIEQVKLVLDWKPKISLREGLEIIRREMSNE